MAETRPRAGGALEMTKPEEVAAQVGVDRRGGATRLYSAVAAERDGERGGGVPGAGRGNGVGAGVRRGTAMPMAVVAQRGSDGSGGGARLEFCGNGAVAGVRQRAAEPTVQAVRRGGGYSDGGVQPELAGKRQSAGATRGERLGVQRVRENWGKGGGWHGDHFYRLGEEKSWPDVADLKRQRPATWVTSWAKWGSIRRQKLGKNGGGGGGEGWLPVPRERGLEEAGNGGDVGGFRRPWQLPARAGGWG
uniref:Retrotransposon protein, putative, Ty3-gypsy subclass n=1 Tax=Oryza sativa subsp. japonica TaxID=39947 RepID=Q2QX84_ORYSJ|nr:retrotransposon protein, putative, Ty3-gypsy subclass [Oryza sativa Japonica Group]